MSGSRVLVVDDEALILQVMKAFFSRRGDDCTVVSSGREALHLMEDRFFDVVLSDVKMPEMDGLELVRRAKAIQPHAAFILISGAGSRTDLLAAFKVGVFDFVDKPITDLEEFTVTVERAAASSRLTQERDDLLKTLKEQNGKLEFSLLKLHEAFGRLREQEEALESDLVKARHVQRRLLPAGFPAVEGMDFYGCFRPCEQLGGDLLGAIPLGDGRLAVYLADVAGHGVSAAMVGVMLREAVRAAHRDPAGERCAEPAKMLAFLNEDLWAEGFDPPIYATMLYAVFDPVRGRVTLASAGHPAPLLMGGGGVRRPVAPTGPVLGGRPSGEYAETEVGLEAGDTLLLYSDGLSEARNAADEEFTRERLCRTLEQCRGAPAAETGRAIESALGEHLGGGPASDDMTFIVARRQAMPASPNRSDGDPVADSLKIATPAAFRFPDRKGGKGAIRGGWHLRDCVIRLTGLATWQLAPVFREMVKRAKARGAGSIQVDLAGCEAMDSTMLGVLLQHSREITLHLPGLRVVEQLREMGVLEQFQRSHDPCQPFDSPIAIEPGEASEACSELILLAHEALMDASESNRRRFEDVVASLRHGG